MRKLRCNGFFGLLLLLYGIGCEQPDERSELLRVTIEPGYFIVGDGAIWAILSDASGRTLDIKEIKGDETELVFSGLPVKSLALTFLSYNIFTNQGVLERKQFYLHTTMGLDANQNIVMSRRPPSPSNPIPPVVDQIPFTINNYSDAKDAIPAFHFSDGFFCCYATLLYNTISYQPPFFSGEFSLRQDPRSVLIVTYRDGIPVHKWMENVSPGNSMTIDFSTFEPSRTIPINKPVYDGQVRSVLNAGFEGDISQGHILSALETRRNSLSSADKPVFQLGYIEGFDKYIVGVQENPLNTEGPNVYYAKAGAIPGRIDLPVNTFELGNAEMDRFSYTFTNEYTYKSASFTIENLRELGINWSIQAPRGVALKAPALPPSLARLYPELANKKLQLSAIEFIQPLDGFTYQEQVANYFAGRIRGEHETLTFRYTKRY